METSLEFGSTADMHNNMSEDNATTNFIERTTVLSDATEQVTILPHDFYSLSCEEIFDLFVKDKKNHMGACAVYVLPRVGSLCNKFKDSFPQDVNWKDLLGKSIAKKKVKLPAKRKRG